MSYKSVSHEEQMERYHARASRGMRKMEESALAVAICAGWFWIEIQGREVVCKRCRDAIPCSPYFWPGTYDSIWEFAEIHKMCPQARSMRENLA